MISLHESFTHNSGVCNHSYQMKMKTKPILTISFIIISKSIQPIKSTSKKKMHSIICCGFQSKVKITISHSEMVDVCALQMHQKSSHMHKINCTFSQRNKMCNQKNGLCRITSFLWLSFFCLLCGARAQ